MKIKTIVELCVLCAFKPSKWYTGYAIIKIVNAKLNCEVGSAQIYPLLKKMVDHGYLERKLIRRYKDGRKAYGYKLTRAGLNFCLKTKLKLRKLL